MIIKVLDLFCGGGGAAVGYLRAAEDRGIKIEITGIDDKPQPNYPFMFIQDDALKYFEAHLHEFDFVHSSPPCQKHTRSTFYLRVKGKKYVDIIKPTRKLILKSGKPGLIENVPEAPIRADVVLRGDLFGLKVIRKRHFECISWFMFNPDLSKMKGKVADGDYVCIYGNASWKRSGSGNYRRLSIPKWRKKTIRETWAYAMGIDWYMTDKEISQSIPPEYTRFIFNEWLRQNLREA